MPNFAERIENENDVHVASGLTAVQWASNPANANGIIGDDTTNAPNVNYINRGTPPLPSMWQREDLTNYEGVVVGYVGTRPVGR